MKKNNATGNALTEKIPFKHFLLIMRTTFILLFACTFCSMAEIGYSQNARVTINKRNVALKEVLNEIEKQTDYLFIYNDEVNTNEKVSVKAKQNAVANVLNTLLEKKDIKYSMEGNHIILSSVDEVEAKSNETKVSSVHQERKRVTGTVVDKDNVPIIGANIIEVGTTNGTVTDVNGEFVLQVENNAVIRVSYIGYLEQDFNTDNKINFEVVLQEDTQDLDEIVVVGFGVQKKINLTGAVDKIDGKTIGALQVNTIGEALMGQVPNLNVDIADGRPGRGASFNIRGTTSLNGGSPLIIIDGVPSTETEMNNLSPRDVEDISVLKDASSAAIYGARGAFGVILIQTKRAKENENRISYSNNFSWSTPTKIMQVYSNAADYLEIIQNEFNNNIGQYGVIPQAEIDYPKEYAKNPSLPSYKFENIGGKLHLISAGPVANYHEEWFRKYTPKQNHNVSIMNSGDKFSYFLSGDFNREEGIISLKPDIVKRYSLRSNLTYNINEHVRLSNNTNFVIRDDDLSNAFVSNWRSNIWRWMEMFNHLLWPLEVEINGETIPTEQGFMKRFVEKHSGDKTNRKTFTNTLSADFNYFDNKLKLHTDFTYRFSNARQVRWGDVAGVGKIWADNNTILNHYGANSYIEKASSNARTINMNAYAVYDDFFNKNHVTITVGTNFEDFSSTREFIQRKNPISIDQHSLNLGTGEFTSNDSDNKFANQSTFFRVSYDYDSKYLFEVNGNYNISSKFPAGKRGAFFSSFSAGWRISEEPFFEPIRHVVDNLKIRGSYGALGNQNIGSWDYLPIMNIALSNFSLEGTQVTYTSNPNPKSANFTWETTKTTDLGLDFNILNNRLSGTLDIYERTTKDMLVKSHSLPSVFGAPVPQENSATLENKGWEISIGWRDQVLLKDAPFAYGIQCTLSDYKAVITDYYNPTGYLGDYYIGKEFGEIWGLNTLGFFETDAEAQAGALLETSGYRNYAAAGYIKFEDVDKDGKISRKSWTLEDHGDYRVIGNSTPRYQYGITLNMSWQGFDLTAFFRGVGKREIYPDGESMAFWGPYSRRYAIMPEHVANDRWTPENPNAYFPRPQGYIAGNGNWDLNTPQTRYLQDASYFRLKNLVCGYSLPNSLVKKMKLSNLRLYVSGQNLFVLTNLHHSLDPEGLTLDPDGSKWVGLGAVYPIQKAYAFGLEIQF